MGKLTVHAGDFPIGSAGCFAGSVALIIRNKTRIPYTDFESIEVASEDARQKSGIGAGIVGGALLGGVGAAAGVLAGRKQVKEVTFSGTLLDGRRIFATIDGGAFVHMQAALFEEANIPLETRREVSRLRRQKEMDRANFKRRLWQGAAAIVLLFFVFAIMTSGESPAPSASASSSR